MEAIRQREILNAVLLKALAETPGGLETNAAYDRIEAKYTFPDEWYREIPASQGYDVLRDQGIPDWRLVSQDRLIELVETETQWKNELRWARNELRKRGLLDVEARRGVWRLNEAGIQAAENVNSTLTAKEREIATPRARKARTTKPRAGATGETLEPSRNRLIDILLALTKNMPLTDLETLVGITRVVRRQSLPDDDPNLPFSQGVDAAY